MSVLHISFTLFSCYQIDDIIGITSDVVSDKKKGLVLSYISEGITLVDVRARVAIVICSLRGSLREVVVIGSQSTVDKNVPEIWRSSEGSHEFVFCQMTSMWMP